MMKTKKLKIKFARGRRSDLYEPKITRMPTPFLAEARQEQSPSATSLGSQLRKVFAKLGMAGEIPTGYEDETGFHVGDEPADLESRWAQL
jgi:hypothetical protein